MTRKTNIIFFLFLFLGTSFESVAELPVTEDEKLNSLQATPLQTAPGISCDRVQTLKHELPVLRNLPFIKEIPCKLVTKEEVETYLDYLLSKEITAKKLEKEEVIYKALGIIPPKYKYKEGIIKLYKEQVGGFYNPEEKFYAMASWMPASLQDPVAIHELTHAVQDQHFDLESLMNPSLFSDQMVARSALIEGDAMLVMTDYSRMLVGLPSILEDDNVSSFMLQTILAASYGGNMKDTPPALQAMLIFPYISGLKFAHSIAKDGGYETINIALKNPPLGTFEILHPEKYLERIQSIEAEEARSHKQKQNRELESSEAVSLVKVSSEVNKNPQVAPKEPENSQQQTELPKDVLPKEIHCEPIPSFGGDIFELTHEDIFGEFGTSIFFIAHAKTNKAPNLSSKWAGDRVCMYESNSKYFLSWEHEWIDTHSKDAFLSETQDIFKKRFSLENLELNTSYDLKRKYKIAQTVRIASTSETKSQVSFIIQK